MARINDLLKQLENVEPELAKEIKTEVKALSDRREFGLNFERHTPEQVELPGRPVRRGDKVHVLPPRGETVKAENKVMWVVTSIDKSSNPNVALVSKLRGQEETKEVAVEDLVVVAEFRDPIYPGLISTGKVERGGDKPYHTVINAENFHALEALMFTHRGKVDCIYIDPPYNTGARDWKYNNDYISADDQYRHSKWLAFMERRLLTAKALLNPNHSVLIVAIDEKEYLRLGLLLEQVFPEARMQMVSTIIKPEGTNRMNEFSRTNEFIFFLMFGDASITPTSDNLFDKPKTEEAVPVVWRNLRRREKTSKRSARPNQFYPIFVWNDRDVIHSVGEPLPISVNKDTVQAPPGTKAIFPVTGNGTEMLWGLVPDSLRRIVDKGYAKVVGDTIQFLTSGVVEDIENGVAKVEGVDANGAVIAKYVPGERTMMPKSVWVKESHNARSGGTLLLKKLLPGRDFPFPKSLYAVEDALRFFVAENLNAVVLDFFSGSGTTAHAVMRLNKEDGGRRQSISITNNELSDEEERALRAKGFRPQDDKWKSLGICEYITKPRVTSVISGIDSNGAPVEGSYKFNLEYPIADGLKENAEFFTLTYESALEVESNRAFAQLAPLLWLKAGAQGERLENLTEGWGVSEKYGVLTDIDKASQFIEAISRGVEIGYAFIFTQEDRLFESISQELPATVTPIRMPDAYFRNSEIETLAANR